jgi:hypothetical protein
MESNSNAHVQKTNWSSSAKTDSLLLPKKLLFYPTSLNLRYLSHSNIHLSNTKQISLNHSLFMNHNQLILILISVCVDILLDLVYNLESKDRYINYKISILIIHLIVLIKIKLYSLEIEDNSHYIVVLSSKLLHKNYQINNNVLIQHQSLISFTNKRLFKQIFSIKISKIPYTKEN